MMDPRDIRTLSIAELCEMYAQARNQVASGEVDLDIAEYANRMADVEGRKVRARSIIAGGKKAMAAAIEELTRREHQEGRAA